MKFRNLLLASVAVLFCTASISATTLAHTWVSGSGSNSNACTFASPCATFQGALAKTTAGGVITAKDAGDFGALTINQSVTIDGNNLGSITFSGSNGINITARANVTVQNLTINALGLGQYGIFAPNGGIVAIDNCKIMNFTSGGIKYLGAGTLMVENSRVEFFIGVNGVNGIEIGSNAAENVVVKSTLIDASPNSNPNYGFIVDSGVGSVTASIQNVIIKGAEFEAVLTDSGVTQITDSVLTQNGYGVYASSGSTVSVANSMITSNNGGVCASATSKIRLDNNDIYDNPTAMGNCGGIVKTSGTNKTSGTIQIPAADVSDSVTF